MEAHDFWHQVVKQLESTFTEKSLGAHKADHDHADCPYSKESQQSPGK